MAEECSSTAVGSDAAGVWEAKGGSAAGLGRRAGSGSACAGLAFVADCGVELEHSQGDMTEGEDTASDLAAQRASILERTEYIASSSSLSDDMDVSSVCNSRCS